MATILALTHTNREIANDSNVTIFGSDDAGNKIPPDPRDQLSWNPPAFAAGSAVRGLTFQLSNLPNDSEVTILLQNLCEPKSDPVSQSAPINTGAATVTFPKDTDPIKTNILVVLLKKIAELINLFKIEREYHLNGQPDACSLYKAEVFLSSKPKGPVYATYYYWTMGEYVTL